MASLHLICRGGLHLRPTRFPEFESGFWDLTEADAARLVGGRIYFHETKNSPSYFGGDVRTYRVAGPEEELPGRIVFTILSRADGKSAAWEGASHAMAWSGGVVE